MRSTVLACFFFSNAKHVLCTSQLYTAAASYEGAAKLYENVLMDCPLYDKQPKIIIQLASVYRRLGNFDHAFHFFLYDALLSRVLVTHIVAVTIIVRGSGEYL